MFVKINYNKNESVEGKLVYINFYMREQKFVHDEQSEKFISNLCDVRLIPIGSNKIYQTFEGIDEKCIEL